MKEVAYELSIFSDRPGFSDCNGFLYQIISDLYVNYLIFFSYRNQDLVCCIKTYHCKNKMSFKYIPEFLKHKVVINDTQLLFIKFGRREYILFRD